MLKKNKIIFNVIIVYILIIIGVLGVSCSETESDVLGCIDNTACNFNLEATQDDGSCIYATEECEQCSGNTDGTGTVVTDTSSSDCVEEDATVEPTLTLALTDEFLSEEAGSAWVVLSLSESTSNDVLVSLGVSGTATLDVDYTVEPSVYDYMVIEAGQIIVTSAIEIIEDSEYEGNEDIEISIDALFNAIESDIESVTVYIIDNDDPSVTLSVDVNDIVEDNGVAVITAELSGVSDEDVEVSLAVSGTEGTYDLSADSITILAGELSAEVTLTAVSNEDVQLNEVIEISIDSIENAVELDDQILVIEIIDDDTPIVTLLADPLIINESSEEDVIVVASIEEAISEDIEIELVVSGSAIINEDFIVNSTELIIAAGELESSTSISMINDSELESIETIDIDVASIVNGIASGSIQISIEDTSVPWVTVTLDPTEIQENGGTATLSASLDATSSDDVAIIVVENETITLENSIITILAGDLSASTIITAVDNETYDGDITVEITIESVENAINNNVDDMVLTIIDDEEVCGAAGGENCASIFSEDEQIYALNTDSYGEEAVVVLNFSPDDKEYSIGSNRLALKKKHYPKRCGSTLVKEQKTPLAQKATCATPSEASGSQWVTSTDYFNVYVQENDEGSVDETDEDMALEIINQFETVALPNLLEKWQINMYDFEAIGKLDVFFISDFDYLGYAVWAGTHCYYMAIQLETAQAYPIEDTYLTMAHEFTHILQFYMSDEIQNENGYRLWISEGIAEANGIVISEIDCSEAVTCRVNTNTDIEAGYGIFSENSITAYHNAPQFFEYLRIQHDTTAEYYNLFTYYIENEAIITEYSDAADAFNEGVNILTEAHQLISESINLNEEFTSIKEAIVYFNLAKLINVEEDEQYGTKFGFKGIYNPSTIDFSSGSSVVDMSGALFLESGDSVTFDDNDEDVYYYYINSN